MVWRHRRRSGLGDESPQRDPGAERFGEIKYHEINRQYQLKNTTYFNHNGLVVKGYRVT